MNKSEQSEQRLRKFLQARSEFVAAGRKLLLSLPSSEDAWGPTQMATYPVEQAPLEEVIRGLEDWADPQWESPSSVPSKDLTPKDEA